MAKKFCILLEDDWEVMGNGLGNVAQLQYLPSLFLMKTLKKLGGTMTFMVDVVHQLRYLQSDISDRNLRMQSRIWEENVLLMKDYGFDVQLHLHPQWFEAVRTGDHFLLGNNWNIGRYAPELQRKMISEGIDYLENLIRPHYPDYKVIAFKGGSWGLQPSETLFQAMADKGVRIIMGVRNGLRLPNSGTDYSNIEEKIMPYYADPSDIRKVSRKKEDIVIVPQPEYAPSIFPMISLGIDLVKQKLIGRDDTAWYYQEPIPATIKSLSPLMDEKKMQFSWNPYRTHLKIGNQPFYYLKSSIDSIIKRLRDYPERRIPLVMESHTKQFLAHYKHIEAFLKYILDAYGDEVEFLTLSQYYRELQQDPTVIRQKN
ncbi:hypothetical protein [Flavihumibacter petaseus]|nr:hypothetical protein [Flavihumibacter petaseus]